VTYGWDSLTKYIKATAAAAAAATNTTTTGTCFMAFCPGLSG